MEDREIRKVLDVLDNAGIRYRMVSHDPVYTIEEMERLHLDADAEIAKNLFLRDARGKRHFLVVLCSCKTVDLKALRAKALYDQDAAMPLRKSHQSPAVKLVYDEYFENYGSHKAHEILHTSYVGRKKFN